MKKTLTLEDVIAEMKRRQGKRTNADFARELGVTNAYLGDIYLGRRTPGPAILGPLGLVAEKRSEIVYRRAA
jgi:hypothetical protein